MALVSSLYRMTASDAYPNKDEAERRLKILIQRLVSQHGQAEVLRRIQEYPVPKDMETMKSWIVLTVWASRDRQRAGTF